MILAMKMIYLIFNLDQICLHHKIYKKELKKKKKILNKSKSIELNMNGSNSK